MSNSKYVCLENVTFVRMKPASVQVLYDEKTVYIPLSQMAPDDAKKFMDPDTEEGSTGHTVSVTRWWADTAELEYEEI